MLLERTERRLRKRTYSMEVDVGSGFGLSRLITRGKERFESESDLYGDDLRKQRIAKASNVENNVNGVGS
jgi:hypothetical protein